MWVSLGRLLVDFLLCALCVFDLQILLFPCAEDSDSTVTRNPLKDTESRPFVGEKVEPNGSFLATGQLVLESSGDPSY